MRHPRPDSIRLKHLQRYFLYAVVALLFFSGVAWTYWNYLAVSPGDFETSAKSWAMKGHGAAPMANLVLIGLPFARLRPARPARLPWAFHNIPSKTRISIPAPPMTLHPQPFAHFSQTPG